MSSVRKIFVTLALIMGVVFMLPSFLVTASDLDDEGNTVKPCIVLSKERGLDDIASTANAISNKSGFKFITYKYSDSDEGYCVYINKQGYLSLDADKRKKLMEVTLNSINNSKNLGKRDQNRFYNFVTEQDETTASMVRELSTSVGGDFVTAMAWFKPFSGLLSTILGFLALLIVALFTLSVLIDIAYLGLPVFRRALYDASDKKPKLISNEAHMSIREAEANSNHYTNCFGLYFKRIVKTYIIIGVTLAYLLNGQIFEFVGFIIDVLQTAIS